MGQGCAAGCLQGCKEAVVIFTSGDGQRRGAVGLERRHVRRMRQSGAQEKALLHRGASGGGAMPLEGDVMRLGSVRHLTPPALCRFMQDPSIEAESYRWEGNLRVGAKVSPACRPFDSEYFLTDTELGSGMSGAVLLATPRRKFSVVDNIFWEDLEACHSSAADTEDAGTASFASSGAPASGSSCAVGAEPPPAAVSAPLGAGTGEGFARRSCSSTSLACSAQVAVKTLEKQGLTETQLQRLLMEVDIYLKMDHANIAKLLRVFNEPDKVYLVMEYCSGGSLCDKLLKSGPFPDQEAANAVRQVLSAVNYCHCHPEGKVCHRDLKHSNFIYTSDAEGARLKLVDFGLSRVLRPHRPQISSYAGTLYYMAPEVVMRQSYDESCDLWSVGVIAYSLLCGEPPFRGATDESVAQAILRAHLSMDSEVWAGVSENAKSFCRELLQLDSSARPSAEQALQHPWLVGSDCANALGGRQVPVPLSHDVLERIVHFAHESAVRRAAAALIVYSCSAPSVDETACLLQAQFHALDVDGNGMISFAELGQALRETLGVTQAEAEWIFSQLDYDGDEELHHSEFLAAAMGTRLLCCAENVREAFSRFDLDSDGKIDLGELLAVLGPRFCGTPTQDIFDQLDINGDRGVDLDEFSMSIASSVMSSPFQPELEPAPEPETPVEVDQVQSVLLPMLSSGTTEASAKRHIAGSLSSALSEGLRTRPVSPRRGDHAGAYFDVLRLAQALSWASAPSTGRRRPASTDGAFAGFKASSGGPEVATDARSEFRRWTAPSGERPKVALAAFAAVLSGGSEAPRREAQRVAR